jgi:hypothetical protein
LRIKAGHKTKSHADAHLTLGTTSARAAAATYRGLLTASYLADSPPPRSMKWGRQTAMRRRILTRVCSQQQQQQKDVPSDERTALDSPGTRKRAEKKFHSLTNARCIRRHRLGSEKWHVTRGGRGLVNTAENSACWSDGRARASSSRGRQPTIPHTEANLNLYPTPNLIRASPYGIRASRSGVVSPG